MERGELLETVAGIISTEDGATSLRIRGECMRPALAHGERITVEPRRVYFPGDVIVFRTSSALVAHRLLGYAPSSGGIGYVTKGDHCARHDGVVSVGRVIGRIGVSVSAGDRVRAVGSFVALVALGLVGRR